MARHDRRKSVSLKPVPASLADMGASSKAQWADCIVEPAVDIDPETGKEAKNPNGSQRRRRLSRIDDMHRRKQLDNRQWQAAQHLQDAWESTLRTPEKIKRVQVDTSPKPDAQIAIQVDRMTRLVAVSRYIPQHAKQVVWWVVCDNRSVASMPGARNTYRRSRYTERLRDGLDALASALNM